MDFTFTDKQLHWANRVKAFVAEHVYPAVHDYHAELDSDPANRWRVIKVREDLKKKARAAGLWNMFMPPTHGAVPVDDTFEFEGPSLTNLEYAAVAEELGRVHFASEVFNCSAPDTGNMEVLNRFGTRAQKDRWLKPLMDGDIRSTFLMTEPEVASSDATNICTSIERDGDHYVVNGHKWWSSGVGDPRCRIAILMGKTDLSAPTHAQQSMLLVPMDTPGIEIRRMLPVFGFDHAPYGHGEVMLKDVRVPVENIILGEGRGFEIAQARLGPGRVHHCMRSIGAAEVALEKMVDRLQSRTAFGRKLADFSLWEQRVADARIEIEMCRLLCYKAADMMDRLGNKAARSEISMIKIAAPRAALKIIDDAIQAFGGAGMTSDPGLADMYVTQRAVRLADGPDEVHWRGLAMTEFRKRRPTTAA